MNLDELQIKISIELDDLNKQLKTLTKDIDKALGPKATKKLMADNNKIIKSGLTAINKTTLNLVKKSRKETTREVKAMSKDINKSLTKAFDINLTKFNSNITSAMNQARQTVRSACNDIRRELNAALNINGNIRVTSKTTISGSATGSSGSNVASNMASSQYLGAMIIKSTNAVIKDNRTNAKRIESKIDKATNKIVSAVKNTAVKNIEVTVKLDSDKITINIPEIKIDKITINIPEIKIPDIKIESANDDSKVIDHLNKLGRINHEGFKLISKSIGQATSKIISVIKSNGSTNNGGIEIESPGSLYMKKAYPKLLGTGSYGSNQLSGSPINFTQGGTSPLDTSQIEAMKKVHELMKQIRSLGRGIPSDTTSFTYGEVITPQKLGLPIEQLKKAKEIIEDVSYRVLDLETGLMNTSNFDLFGLGELDTSQVEAMKKAFKDMQNIRKQSRMPRLNEPTEDYDTSEFMAKELHRQVASLMDMAQELNEAFHQTPMGIDKAVQQANFLEEALDAVLENSKDLTSLSPQIAKSFEFARDILNQMTPGIRALANEIRNFTKPQAPAGIPALEWQEISPSKRPQAPASIIGDIEWRDIDDIDSSKLNDIKAQLQEIGEEFEDIKDEMLSLGLNPQFLEETLSSLEDWIKPLEEALGRLNEIDNKRIALNIDTTDAKNQIEALRTLYESTIEALRTVNNGKALIDLFANLDDSKKDTNTSNKGDLLPVPPRHSKPTNEAKPSKTGKSPKPTIMGFGFGAYKNEIDTLVEYAKKAGPKIKKALSVAFNPIDGPNKLDSALTRIESKVISVFNKIKKVLSKVFSPIINAAKKIITPIARVFKNIVASARNMAYKIRDSIKLAMYKATALVRNYGFVIKTHLNKAFTGIKSSKLYTSIASGLNKAKSAVSKFSGKVKPILNKAFSGIKVGAKVASNIGKGLSKAKGVLNKFANSCKTVWGKIKQIFSKGANDASKATGKLTSGLKGLLAQAFGFFSIYSLINLGREAITQSQTLAQAEIKLTSLMKQRMGATNDTVTAIRQLIEEQSKLGVVSKTALTRGAEQLSMYVHSAKALKELMPAIANLTAKRGGFMATEDDAEEVATQLGEAIREGTTTPLEQSGIYLTEAEIEKFKHLTTEEARAAYLADVIAKNVGNINQALANTPIGAMTQLKNNFKELLSTLGIFLANVLKPIVQWLNTIVVACNNALKALGKLLGFDMTGGATSVGDIGTGGGSTEIDTGGVDSATDSYNDAADAADKATEANEKFKGSLMGFDEINVLSDNTNKNKDDFDPTDITPGEGGQLIPEVGELTEADSIFSKFSDKMKAFMDEILEPFKNAWALLGDRWKAEWADLIDSFKHFCDSLATFLKSVWEHGGKEFVQHLAEIGLACGIAAMEIGGEILDSLARLWEHLDPSKNMNTQGFLDALNEVSVKLRDFILGLGDHFESFMANGGQDLLNAFGDLAMNIGEAIVRGFGVGIDALDGLIDHLDPANNPKTKKMLKTWEETFGSIGDMALDFVGLLESTLRNGGQEIINSLGDLGVGILDAAGIIIGEIAKTFSELFKHMDPAKNENSKNMLESFDKFVDSLSDFVDAIAKAFKKFMDSGGREFVKNLGDILAIVADLAFTLGGGIIDLITGFINSFVGQKLIEGVAKALEWFSDKLLGLKDAVQIIKDAFQDVIDIIVGIFEGDGEKVGRAFASLIKNALKLTGELVEWLVQLGMDLVAGLVKGICSLPKLLWEAVKFLFDTIVGFFKELFGIHSPSTVFADLGVNLIEGLIEGIKGMLGAVGDVLSEIGEAIFGWFEDILSSASENWNKLCDETSKKWGELKENVSDKCKDIYEDTKEKWTDIKDKTIEIASDLKDKAVEKYTQLKDKLTDTTDKWRQNSEEKWNKVKEKTSEIVSNLKSTVEEKYTKFKDALTDTMEKWRANSEDKWSKIKSKTTELVGNLKSDVEEKYNTFKENLTNKLESWKKTSEEKWNNIKSKTTELVGNLKSDVEQKYETLKSNLGSKMENLKSDMQTKWENIKSKTTEIVNNLKSEAEKKYGELKTNLGTKLEEVKSEASSKWESIKTTTSTKVREVVDEATKKYGEMKSSFTKKMDEVKTALGPKWTELKNSVKTNASGIASKVSEGLSNVKQKFTKPFEDAKKAVGEVINSIGRTFSNANWSFPKIKLPHIKVTGEWSFNPPRVPSFGIEWRKRGGIIDGITPIGFANGALQMGGEAGKEMVVPLENTSFTSKIAQAMGQAVDNAMARNMNGYYGSSYNVIDDNRDIVLKINDREFARASINSINKLQRESGRTLLDI